MKKTIIVGLFIGLVFAQSAFAWIAPKYLYAVHLNTCNKQGYKILISKIDATTGNIVAEINANDLYDNLSLQPNGDLLLANSRNADSFLNTIDRVKDNGNSIETFMQTKGAGPMRCYTCADKNYVLMFAPFRGNPQGAGIEIYENREGMNKYLKTICLGKYSNAYSSNISLGTDNKYVFASSYEMISAETDGLSRLFKIDCSNGEIVKVVTEESRFGFAYAIIALPGNKIYVKGRSCYPGESSLPLNKIMVYSANDLSFIKSIEANPEIFRFVYAPDLKAVFGYRRDCPEYPFIDLFDIKKDCLIKTIKIGHVWDAVYAGNGKIYASVIGASPGLLIINIKTGKRIKKIPGNYIHLSFC